MSAGWPAPRHEDGETARRRDGQTTRRGDACVARHANILSPITHHPITLTLAAPLAHYRPNIARRGAGSGLRLVALSRGRCRGAGWGRSRLQHLALGD